MDVDECATDRQEDVWEPLIAIARVAGGNWELRIRQAAKHMAGSRSDGASETVSHQLLTAFQKYFNEHGEKAATKTFISCMNEIGDFAEVNYGRGLTPHYVAKLLKPYGIEPRDVRIDGVVLKGYDRASFDEAFQTYLSPSPESAVSKRDNATTPVNIEGNPPFEKATGSNRSVSENAVSANVHAGCSVVADSKSDTSPNKVYV